MELYKFINENKIQKYKGGFVVVDNRIYTNPTEETVKKAGYKELANVAPPEFNYDNEYLVLTYIDGDIITPVYEVRQFEIEEETEL